MRIVVDDDQRILQAARDHAGNLHDAPVFGMLVVGQGP